MNRTEEPNNRTTEERAPRKPRKLKYRTTIRNKSMKFLAALAASCSFLLAQPTSILERTQIPQHRAIPRRTRGHRGRSHLAAQRLLLAGAPAEESGRPPMAVTSWFRSPTAANSKPDRWARSASRNPIPTSFMSAWASRMSVAMPRTGDGVLNPPTQAKPGRTSALENTLHIGALIQVHPKNADIVYVAAFGHL